nr:dolichyl-phosphate-mannose--protein mannosyltransferase [Pseudomonadota bacterium]
APFVAYAAVAVIAVRLRDWRAGDRSVYAVLNGNGQRHWPALAVVPALIALGCVSIAVYFLTFTPAFFYTIDPLTMHDLLPFQLRMYAEQTQVLPSHPYQSSWWTWPLLIRPIWYLYEPVDGAVRGVLMIGNPAVCWGGLIAVIACFWAAWRDGAVKLFAVAMLWVGAFAMWILIPKSLGFFYYYYLPSIFLALPLAGVCQHYARGKRAYWDETFVVICAVLFAYFYPIISAMPLAGPQSFHRWMWFGTWP